MATTAQPLRGAVRLCEFPYEERPHQRGPQKHFCLVAEEFIIAERRYLAVAYGTSRLDTHLLRAHAGAVFSVPTQFVKIARGYMRNPVTHFVCSHVALIDEHWVDPSFQGRLDFIRPELRTQDPLRARLYDAFCTVEPLLENAALSSIHLLREQGVIGLPPGARRRLQP